MRITNRLYLSGCIIAIILYLLAVANYFVLLFKDEVIMPTDIFAIGTAMNVASKYSFKIYAEMFMSAAYFICACGFLSIYHNFQVNLFSVKRKLWKAGLMVALGTGYIICINKEAFQNTVNISTNSWKRVLQCKEEVFY